MTWLQFITWSVIVLAVYYAVNIARDSLRNKNTIVKDGSEHVLHFTEQVAPVTLTKEKPQHQESPGKVQQILPVKVEPLQTVTVFPTATESAVEGMGVTLKGIFDLAKVDAIEFTKSVSFQQ